MENRKIRLGILFGGKSAEHEVSLLSAKNIVEALDKQKYDISLIGIDKSGAWHLRNATQYLTDAHNPHLVRFEGGKEQLILLPQDERKEIVSVADNRLGKALQLDVIFPILHGTFGEDGTVQGLLKLANIPFVGAGVLGSAVGMDKDVMKRLLRDAGIPIAQFICVRVHERKQLNFANVVKELGLPFFVKPANLGSSVGISKVKSESDFLPAIDDAFKYDQKILIEKFIRGREIECSVLGNEHPIASLPGEVIPHEEFYSYDAKYVGGADFKLPVELPPEITQKVQQLAIDTFHILCCEGMARVDFFLKENGDLIVNEINTIPGFTNRSPYPQLWKASGLPYAKLLDRLIELALERHAREKALLTCKT